MMELGILQACKQVYHEGKSVFYSQNVYAISELKQMSHLVMQIGLVNLKLIRKLQIIVKLENLDYSHVIEKFD